MCNDVDWTQGLCGVNVWGKLPIRAITLFINAPVLSMFNLSRRRFDRVNYSTVGCGATTSP